jgi:hypothetical protein
MTHIDRVRALLTELGQALDQLEAEKAPVRAKPPRKVKRRGNVQLAIAEARRAARKGT